MENSSRSSRIPTGLVAVVVFAIAVAALLLLLGRGDDPMLILEDYDPRGVEAAVQQALSPIEMRPSGRLRLTARNLRWFDDAGRTFLEAPVSSMTLTMGAPPDGGILLSGGVIQSPRIHLVQIGEERWNYEAPLAWLLDEDVGDDGPELGVRMRDVSFQGGHVLLDLLEARYEARSVNGHLSSAELAGPGVDAPVFRVGRAEAELVLPDTADERVTRSVTLADAEFRLLEGAMAFDVDRATFGGSRFAAIRGVWEPGLGGFGLDLRLTALEARVADLPWLPGEVPEGASGTFQLRVEPRPGERTALELTQLDLRAPGSAATGSFRAVIGGAQPVFEAVDLRVDPLSVDLVEAFTGPLPYGGTVTGTVQGTGDDIRFDLRGRLTTPAVADPFTTDVVGRVSLSEAGVSIRDVTVTLDELPLAALEAIAPGLPFAGPISGTVRITGPPAAGPLDLDVRFEAGGGIVTLTGTADLSDPVPAYDLSGRLVGVRLGSILAPPVPPVSLHAQFELDGRGTDPRTATASLSAHGRFSGWASEPGDTLALTARVAGGAVDVGELQVEVGPIELAAGGRWDYEGGGGTLQYQLAVTDMGPVGAYLPPDASGRPRFAEGSLQLAGTVTGTLDEPAAAGDVSAEGFRWGEWAAGSLSAEYDVHRTADGLPRIDARVVADALRTPMGAFDRLEAMVDLDESAFGLALRADQPEERGILAIEADGIIDEAGRREVFVRSMEVDLAQQRWRLPQPARIAWTVGDSVRLENVELLQTEGDGRIAVDGIIAPVEVMDLSVDIAGLPVGDVLELMGSDVELSGDLSAEGRVSGPGDDPSLDLRVTLQEGTFRGVAVRSVVAQVGYEGTQLEVDGEGLLGEEARIRIAGALPARLQLTGAPLFALVDDAPIDLEIVTRTFPLATLDPGLPNAEDLEGRIEANLRVGGTPAEPRLSGSAQILEGALTVPLLERRFENIRGAVLLSGREARIRELVVESDGFARVTGTLDFQELTNPALNLAATLERFRFQNVEDQTAAGLWGDLRLEGTLAQPALTGDILADDGAISLIPLQQPELSARLAGQGGELPALGMDTDFGAPAGDEGLRIQGLTVTAGNDLWFVTEEARARLSGTLTVDKIGEDLPIQGTLQGEGGTFLLRVGPITRQFQIASSELRFLGSPEPNPRIDIVASRLVRVPDGATVDVLDVRVHVTGSLESPSLSLGTATGADVPESELLSFLLFGRPTSDVGSVAASEGVRGALGQGLAYAGLADVLAAQIHEEVAFLDYLRLDYVPGLGLFATAGVELSEEVFLETDLPVGTEVNVGAAVGLEWQTDAGTFRGGYEPVQPLDRLVMTRAISLLQLEVQRQLTFSWRRRWTY